MWNHFIDDSVRNPNFQDTFIGRINISQFLNEKSQESITKQQNPDLINALIEKKISESPSNEGEVSDSSSDSKDEIVMPNLRNNNNGSSLPSLPPTR